MKTVQVFLSLAFFCLSVSGVCAASGAATEGDATKKLKVNYNHKYQCVMICKGQKPTMEALEDGLAYALDIPLALLSPVTAPVMDSLLDKFDSGPDRTYYPSGANKK